MSKITSKKYIFDELDLTDVVSFNVYYLKDSIDITYDTPFVSIPVVAGQTAYEVDIPSMVPIGEGTYSMGVAAVDDAGNISDIDIMSDFFDFTAPSAPKWRK
jgi:hypothetical protein